ncbi:hypothetical protein [Flavobacterium beibuense]|uniref:hypothetical protein n=1 Tax=Flavobacterium beibuense TaxID=657326 RepID=UPI003A94C81A
MLDYKEQITDYLKANFTPSNDTLANFKQTTNQLLNFLFNTFPRNCISDYELNDILLELGYKRQTWVEDTTVSLGEEKGVERFEIHKNLVTGWCLKSPFSLVTEEIG